MARFKVTAKEVNIRPQPNTDNTPIGRLKQGATVEKLGEGDDWCFVKISLDDDAFIGEIAGWISSKYLAPASQPVDLETGEPRGTGPAFAAEPFSIDSNLKERPSPLTAALIDTYLQEKDSPLAGIGAAVIATANKYSINASYILSHAIHETGWGTSRISKEKNNLFGWGAIDSDPLGGAGTFPSREACIDYVMGKVNELYLTPTGRYFESKPCLGNKSYGMNVHYASDPKWGAKVARIALAMEDWASEQAQPPEP